MFLSQLSFNLRHRDVRADLADRYELHRTLMSAFPEQLPEDERMLYRVEEQRDKPTVTVLVQSRYLPDWGLASRMQQPGYLVERPQFRQIAIESIDTPSVRFRLQANPTVKRDGKRHALHADEMLLNWLQRKGDDHGFRIDPLYIQMVKLGNRYGQNRRQTWHAVQFDGVLDIIDRTAFIQTLINGIGSAKGFGFGLLSIRYRSA